MMRMNLVAAGRSGAPAYAWSDALLDFREAGEEPPQVTLYDPIWYGDDADAKQPRNGGPGYYPPTYGFWFSYLSVSIVVGKPPADVRMAPLTSANCHFNQHVQGTGVKELQMRADGPPSFPGTTEPWGNGGQYPAAPTLGSSALTLRVGQEFPQLEAKMEPLIDPFIVWLARATRVSESLLYVSNPYAP